MNSSQQIEHIPRDPFHFRRKAIFILAIRVKGRMERLAINDTGTVVDDRTVFEIPTRILLSLGNIRLGRKLEADTDEDVLDGGRLPA